MSKWILIEVENQNINEPDTYNSYIEAYDEMKSRYENLVEEGDEASIDEYDASIQTDSCAGLVHDGRKSGASDDVKEVFTVFDHPLLMAEAVRKHKEDAVISDKEIELIANAIESHMGQWTTSNKPKDAGIVLPKPSNKYQEIVHLADYLASRKPLDMEFDEWKKPELPPLDTYVLNFGKYNNERLVEVAQKDKGYIDWLKENYGREPVRSLLKQL